MNRIKFWHLAVAAVAFAVAFAVWATWATHKLLAFGVHQGWLKP